MTMRERDLEAIVVAEAAKAGWMRYHVPDSRRTTPGFPDEVLLHPGAGRLLLVELKQDGGQLTPAQQAWVKGLAGVRRPPETYVWRPKRLDFILSTLREP